MKISLPKYFSGIVECRHSYQGSEKDDELKGVGNSYTTHFRQLDPRIGRWLSIDPKATAWESPYVSMGNNPVLFNDIFGDTFDPQALYAKGNDANGNSFYLYEEQIKAFEVWACTDEGRKYILDHAKAGYTLTGVFVEELSIHAKNDGHSHTAGIDVKIDPNNMSVSGSGSTEAILKADGRLELQIHLAYTVNMVSTPMAILTIIETISHEVFFHATYFESLYTKGILNTDNLAYYAQKEHAHARRFSNVAYYDIGSSVLMQATDFLYAKSYDDPFFYRTGSSPNDTFYMNYRKSENSRSAGNSMGNNHAEILSNSFGAAVQKSLQNKPNAQDLIDMINSGFARSKK